MKLNTTRPAAAAVAVVAAWLYWALHTTIFLCEAAGSKQIKSKATPSTGGAAGNETCAGKYGSPSFINIQNMFNRRPPALLSFPGSGNSWSRLLIEYATGIHTGSLEIRDVEYQSIFRGERSCGIRMSAIKAHPKDIEIDIEDKVIALNNVPVRRKCIRGYIRNFTRAVVVTRHPMNAFWANYQLQWTHTHTGVVPRYRLNLSHWVSYANQESFDWSTAFMDVISPLYSHFNRANLLTYKYEDLHDKAKRIDILSDVTAFLGYEATRERLECSFKLAADKHKVHRSKGGDILNATEAFRMLGKPMYCQYSTRLSELAKFFNYSVESWIGAPFNCSNNALESTLSPTDPNYCPSNYGHIVYRPVQEILGAKPPPLLLTYPGSGNSWSRALLEYATGIHTGSLEINDEEYQGVFKAEEACGLRMAAIKGHPKDVRWDSKTKTITFYSRPARKKCNRGSVRHFNRAIIVMRNPYDAMWANYQLQVTRSHTGALTINDFNKTHFTEYAENLSNSWGSAFINLYLPLMRTMPRSMFTVVQYADLANHTRRIDALRQMVHVIDNDDLLISTERLSCAFALASTRSAHVQRSKGPQYISSSQAFQHIPIKSFRYMMDQLSQLTSFFNYSAPKRLEE